MDFPTENVWLSEVCTAGPGANGPRGDQVEHLQLWSRALDWDWDAKDMSQMGLLYPNSWMGYMGKSHEN